MLALPAAAEPAPAAKSAAPATTANGGDDFAARLGATGSAGASATQALNPRTTVAQGTLIPAVLETAIDTDVPGYARAIVSADVRSFDGSRVLVPRSSRLVGQYKSGLQAGRGHCAAAGLDSGCSDGWCSGPAGVAQQVIRRDVTVPATRCLRTKRPGDRAVTA